MPGVRTGDVAAFSVDHDAGDQVIVLIELRGRTDPASRERMIADVAGLLRGRHGLESRVALVPPGSLPRTSSGKLSRAWSRQKYLSGAYDAAIDAGRQVA